MGVDYFQPAKLRIERAVVCASDMASAWNEYLARHPFEFELLRTNDTQWVFRVIRVEPFPTELPLLFGEWLHNLRSALDYIVWATAVHTSGQIPPPGEGELQYPIYDSPATWERNLRKLRPLAPHHREMLLIMQPFSSNLDTNYLRWINRLARIDRHRTLNEWTARLAVMEPVVRIPSGVAPKMEWGRRVFVDGVCDFARLTFRAAQDADGLEGNPRVGIDPEIADWGESDYWGPIRFTERLNLLNLFVQVELGTYEFDCTGASEHHALSEAFLAESDARRAGGMFGSVRGPTVPDIQWVEAKDTRRTNERRFRGEDFHPHGSGQVTS